MEECIFSSLVSRVTAVRALALILLEILAETFVIHLFSQGKQSAAETRILLFFVQAGGLIFYPQTVLNSIFALFNFQSLASYLSASGLRQVSLLACSALVCTRQAQTVVMCRYLLTIFVSQN